MNIAISNIAWNQSEDEEISKLLQEYNIEGIEIAPTKIWKDPTSISDEEIASYKWYWHKKKVKIIAMQSLLFGHPQLTIFESTARRKKTIAYLTQILRIASLLGIDTAVFGSQKNRRKGGLDEATTNTIAEDFFSSVGNVAKHYGVHFCIEANPKTYETDFLLTTKDVITFIKHLNHPYVNTHLDSGAMKLNKEDCAKTIRAAVPFFHFHISEPFLKPVPLEVDHKAIVTTLKEIQYTKWVSIEMRAKKSGSNINQIRETLEFVTKTYR